MALVEEKQRMPRLCNVYQTTGRMKRHARVVILQEATLDGIDNPFYQIHWEEILAALQ